MGKVIQWAAGAVLAGLLIWLIGLLDRLDLHVNLDLPPIIL